MPFAGPLKLTFAVGCTPISLVLDPDR